MSEEKTRFHETRIEIDADVAEVWKAITQPEGLARWFAPKMTVEPGVGGFVLADWGPGMEWKTLIEVWEPNRHLRLTETRDRLLTPPGVNEPLAPARLVQDYFLEARGGKTVLRLVHSGFGTSEAWDAEYEGTRGGWAACFLRLKHGLERHRNEPVHNFITSRVCHGVGVKQALEMVEQVAPRPMEVVMRADSHLCGILPELNGAVFTTSVQRTASGSVAYLEVLLFAANADVKNRVEGEWKEKLERLFPASA